MQRKENSYVWNPWPILTPCNVKHRYAIIVLNNLIQSELKTDLILEIWESATVRITVDGGTDAWLSWLKTNEIEADDVTPPELLTGDMDSITKKALQYFSSNRKTKVIVTEDQNKTDFTKSVIELQLYLAQNNLEIDDVIVFAATAGRFDQLLSNINTLFYAVDLLPNVNMYILASDSLTWLLSEGSHVIQIPPNLSKNQEWCSLIPIGAPCLVTTTGLKWNLTKSILEFGNLVSTSNTYNGEQEVCVHTDSFLVWSMSISKFSKDCV